MKLTLRQQARLGAPAPVETTPSSVPGFPIHLGLGRILLCLLVLAWVPSALASDALLEPQVFALLRDELSGQLAKEHVLEITRHHRIQGSRGYSDAAKYILETLAGFGYGKESAWIESYPSDGKVHYQTWQSPSGWHIDSGELRMVAPSEELLVRFPEVGMSVITYSNAGGVRAELVDVGAGTSDADYEGKDVAGKIVLASGYGGDVHRLAVLKYEAAAVVCYLDDERAPQHPDMIGYTGMWPRTEELSRVTFGFNLSNRQGRRLKEMLAAGKRVVLDGQVRGVGLEPGMLDVVVAVIPGSRFPDEELIFTAHLDHPKESANDNASGSAALLDMARALGKLVREGRFPRPQRTLRFLWVPEFYGTMAYIDSHPEVKGPRLGGKVLANLNLDMVGENLELLHSRLQITWTPANIASALTDVTARMAAHIDALESDSYEMGRSNFNYRVTPYSGGSDHAIFNDGAIGVPGVMLSHSPDYAHHTTEDTPDKVDPIELERCELIAASSFWYLANLTEAQSLELINLVAANAQARLIRDNRKAVGWLLKAEIDQIESYYEDGKEVVDFAMSREQDALDSVLDFAAYESTVELVETFRQSLEGQAELQRRTLHAIFYQRAGRFPIPRIPSDAQQAASQIVPTRKTRGPLGPGLPALRLAADRAKWYSTPQAAALDRYLLVNLIDGRRSVLEIRNALTAATQPANLAAVRRFIEDLATLGLVGLETGSR